MVSDDQSGSDFEMLSNQEDGESEVDELEDDDYEMESEDSESQRKGKSKKNSQETLARHRSVSAFKKRLIDWLT
jgi:hypothetical protein